MLYIMSASYDKTFNGVKLKLYNDETERVEEWTDIDFRAYFLMDRKPRLRWKSIVKIETVQKYDALHDKIIDMWKVILDNPLAVRNTHKWENMKAWENHIKFYQCYIYDNDIKMGMPHVREKGKLVFQVDQGAQHRIQEILSRFKDLTIEDQETFEKWATLIEYPAPHFKRASLDIEVYSPKSNQIPNSDSALYPVLAACLASSHGERIALLLTQENKKLKKIPDNVDKLILFTDEKQLIIKLFKLMQNYPFILTFNGDDFDLKYLYNRALRLGILEKNIPITATKYICTLRHGFHIDLYKFFSIRAMKIYAFKAKYKNEDLDTVSKALIGKGKLIHHDNISDMGLSKLIRYCMNDAEITLELTTFNNDLVMNLILMIQRISRMPIEGVSRRNVSIWIKSFMLYEHRQRNILIPIPEEIKEEKGQIISEAIIKGKKYKGAIVFDPVSGTHFLVIVLDFASLYPSIIKVFNIGYSTINCPHESCRTNTVGNLPHWLCKRYKSLESLLIGSLRDLRVGWYKKRSKDKSLDKKVLAWYSCAEQSIKVIMNASYGVFGAESFVFYCPPVAEEVTSIARYMIKSTAEKAQSMGIKVLYGDTDSIFIVKPSEEKIRELIDWTEQQHGIELEIDKVYRYLCLSERKKNYLGVKEDGEVDVKGLTGKKKHTPKIIRDVFDETKKILSKVQNREDLENGKRKIVVLLRKTYSTFKNRSWKNMSDLTFNITLGSELNAYTKTTPQHVKAAKLLVEQGYQIGAGSIISFVKTNEKLARGMTVKPLEIAKKEEVDVRKYIEFLQSTFEQVLDPLNISFDEDILGITKMTTWLKK